MQTKREHGEPYPECVMCNGTGAYADVEAGHAPDCDGSCEHCPVPVQAQVECRCRYLTDEEISGKDKVKQ